MRRWEPHLKNRNFGRPHFLLYRKDLLLRKLEKALNVSFWDATLGMLMKLLAKFLYQGCSGKPELLIDLSRISNPIFSWSRISGRIGDSNRKKRSSNLEPSELCFGKFQDLSSSRNLARSSYIDLRAFTKLYCKLLLKLPDLGMLMPAFVMHHESSSASI